MSRRTAKPFDRPLDRDEDGALVAAIAEDLQLRPEARHGYRVGEDVTVHCLPADRVEHASSNGTTVPVRVRVEQHHLDRAAAMATMPLADLLAETERTAIASALRQHHGNVRAAARALDVAERTLWHKITAVHHLDPDDYRPRLSPSEDEGS